MRLVIAECTVNYAGRLSAHLPRAVRLLMVKADGSVSIHADGRAYKPLNWMSPPCTLIESGPVVTAADAAESIADVPAVRIHTDEPDDVSDPSPAGGADATVDV
ncbi:MAG: DUF91 domain-containing protein, partial [Actinomycetales bacterium]|nr:DUF91 domain-containing protein [Actinomycetales bacterium]